MAGKKYTDQQKEEFFRLLDRGGTVRAAARAVGVHENAGYNWLRKRWSPQQISHRLIKDFPTTPQMRASTETIYQAIYVHARGELTRELDLCHGWCTRSSW
ncbi:hypothetical protein BK799_31060 [Rhodococcus sp. D-1]|nr:hypothetical protein BK799_31060 [Rhodococcus sp. D-1]